MKKIKIEIEKKMNLIWSLMNDVKEIQCLCMYRINVSVD